MNDEEIKELIKKHSEIAVELLDKKYHNLLYSIIYSVLGNHEDTEEVLNDVLYKVWNLKHDNIPENLKGYIVKIARSTAIDRYRQKSAQKRIESTYTQCLDEISEIIPAKENVEDVLIENELIKEMECFINSLPQRQRKIFVYRYYYLMSPAKISAELDMPKTMVNIYTMRIRNKLKDFLRKKEL